MQAFKTSFASTSRRALVVSSTRSFFTTPRYQRDATQIAKETADAVNKKAGEAVLKGVIEPGEKAVQALYDAAGVAQKKGAEATKDLKGKVTDASYEAEKLKAEAGKKVNQAAAEAKKAAQ